MHKRCAMKEYRTEIELANNPKKDQILTGTLILLHVFNFIIMCVTIYYYYVCEELPHTLLWFKFKEILLLPVSQLSWLWQACHNPAWLMLRFCILLHETYTQVRMHMCVFDSTIC
jgi:hypothetical protein